MHIAILGRLEVIPSKAHLQFDNQNRLIFEHNKFELTKRKKYLCNGNTQSVYLKKKKKNYTLLYSNSL